MSLKSTFTVSTDPDSSLDTSTVLVGWTVPVDDVFDPGEDESRFPESYLMLELQGAGADVQLTLTHMPVPEWAVPQTRMGWHTYLDMIETVARGAPAPPREPCMQRNAARYGVDLDNLRSGDS